MILNHQGTMDRGLDERDLTERVVGDIRELFSTMMGRADLSPLSEQLDPVTHFADSLSAMVGLAGSYDGVVGLHIPQELAMEFTSDMLGVAVTEMNDDVHDAMGEIANIIAGAFKLRLTRGGTDIRLSIPSVVTGKDYFIAAGSPSDALTLGFDTEGGRFLVSAALKRALDTDTNTLPLPQS